MKDVRGLSRREVVRGMAGALVVPGLAAWGQAADKPVVVNGRIKQSVSKWCYGKIPLEKFAQDCQKMGLKGIDLLNPKDFEILKKYNLVCTMTNSSGINPGLNRVENHEKCIVKIREAIEATSAAGFPNVICMSGNREGLADDVGAKNCVEGVKKIVKFAEEKKVTLCMELLNSKVNHKDYQCDSTEWGVGVVKAVGSPNFKLLFDIYHMAVQGEDVVAMIKKHHECFGHYHTAGVAAGPQPGRNEIDLKSQTLDYAAIMKVILETGYKGYVAHEFIPKRDPMTSLAEAVKICDV